MNHTVSFRGTGREYFSVWIVNAMLKTVTLNVYSAWAKVRKRRYFAEKLFIDDEPFEYLANPMTLFRGWLIAAAAFVIYMVTSHFSPLLSVGVMLVIAAFIPWVVVKSRIFNARNRAFRNIRFGFAPKYGEAYRVILGLSLLIPLTLGILLPYVMYRQKRFFVENSSYGTTQFSFKATPWEFYKIYLRLILWVIALGLLSAVLIIAKMPKLGMLLPIAVYLVAIVYYKTAVANLVWNRTELGGIKFYSSMKTLDMCWLYLSSGIAVICSFGLLFPWASVRMMRYRCEHLVVRSREGIEKFVADTTPVSTGALGEEVGDMLGLDFDIAF